MTIVVDFDFRDISPIINAIAGEVQLCSDGLWSEPGRICSHGWVPGDSSFVLNSI